MDGNQRFTGLAGSRSPRRMVTMNGMSLQPNIFIPDAERVIINEDGSVRVTYPNDPSETTIGQIQLVEFLNPAGLQAVGGNLFQATPESGQQMLMDAGDGFVNIQQGFIESSNVDIAEELINMVVAQRLRTPLEGHQGATRCSDRRPVEAAAVAGTPQGGRLCPVRRRS